jgi:hypothetical protein
MKKKNQKILLASLGIPVIIIVYLTYVLFAPNIFPKKAKEAFVCIPNYSTPLKML